MRKKVMLIIFLLLLILLIIAIFVGIKIGSFEILSIYGLEEKNKTLNDKIETASSLTSVKYPETIDKLEETYDKYNIQKQKYEEIAGFADDNKNQVYETKQYDIGYLWKIIGKYATSHNLTIGMDVKTGSGQDLYNLHFNISGQYVNTSEFIKELENNSDLSFRIYNFKMTGSSEIVSSSFVIKDVNIDPSTITTVSSTDNIDDDIDIENNSTEDNNIE